MSLIATGWRVPFVSGQMAQDATSSSSLALMVPVGSESDSGDAFPLTAMFDFTVARDEVGQDAGHRERMTFTPRADLYVPALYAWEFEAESWESFTGLSPADVDVALVQPQAGGGLQLFGGSFDRDTLVAAWEANGYSRKVEGDSVWAYSGAADELYAALESAGLFPLLSVVGRGFALLQDNVVAMGEPELLEQCAMVVAGEEPSFASAGPPQSLLRSELDALTETLVIPGQRFLNTGFTMSPSLNADQRKEAMAFEAALLEQYGPTPVPSGVLLGSMAGAADPAAASTSASIPATCVAVVALKDRGAAQVFLDMVVARFEQHLSLIHGEPLTHFLELVTATVNEESAVRLEFRAVGDTQYDLLDMFGAGDLSFLQYEKGG